MTGAWLLAQMMRDLTRAVQQGTVPRTVASFSELHDYIDANCLGGLCDDDVFDVLVAQFGGRDEHEGMPQGMLDLINQNQNAIDLWIKSGALLDT